MKINYLIQNGTVVDGTGAPAYQADVRVRDGRIVEIGTGLAQLPRDRVIDAADCYVTPGTIEQHNHWDAAIWWSPMMEPSAGYGITTSINGACGFSLAPLSAKRDIRPEVVDILNYFEDIPEAPTLERLPWDWRTWGEYKRSMERNVRTATNIAFLCGHVTLRIAVMGDDAWTRAATPDEVQEMCELVDEALSSGALGFSSNLLDYDRKERPLPPIKADEVEMLALMKVVASHPKAVWQVPVDALMRRNAADSVRMLHRLLKQVPTLRIHIAGWPPVLTFQKAMVPELVAQFEEMKAEGLDVWAGYHHLGYSLQLNFVASLLFAQQGNFVWQEIVNELDEDKKIAMLRDPEWRSRARHSWDNQFDHTLLNRPAELLLRESETGRGPTGIYLADYMARQGVDHPSDALADWVLENGMKSVVLLPAWEVNEELLFQLVRDPKSLGNLSDFGAHNTLFCGAGHNIMLLTDFVRDRKLLSIEEAIHSITGRVADHFRLDDRGVIAVGKRADITVFNLDEIEVRREVKKWDVPDGSGGLTFRYVRDAAPMRLTLVEGVATFDNGEVTGNFPGRLLTHVDDDALQMAAE